MTLNFDYHDIKWINNEVYALFSGRSREFPLFITLIYYRNSVIMKIRLLSVILYIVTIFSCQDNKGNALIKKTLILSGNNKGNLEKVLSNSEWNNLQSEAAKFLIVNMESSFSFDTTNLCKYRPLLYELDSLRQTIGNQRALNIINQKWNKANFDPSFSEIYSTKTPDIQTITSDYLINDIKQAFESWENSIFKDSINYDSFQQYILPYRIKNGYIIEDWRSYFRERFKTHYNKYISPVEMVDSVMELINDYQVNWVPISNYPFICLSDYEKAKMSKCPERCWFNAMLFRSLGLPCTIDYVPAWGNRNSGHEWNTILINGKTYPFESTGGRGKWKPKQVYNNEWVDEYWMKSRLPKVFRYTYEINQKGPDTEDAPPLFKQRNYADVSAEYFKTTDIAVENKYAKSAKNEYAYLCVFNEDKWKPVHWGKKIKRNKYEFEKMGRNIAYLPVFYNNGLITPINDAFILDSLGHIKYLKPDTLNPEKINVIRKYLTRPDLDFWLEWNLGSYFEVAPDRRFKNKKNIFVIDELEMYPTIHHLKEPINTRFLRYVFSNNYDCLAELYFYSKDSKGDLTRIEDKKIISEILLDTVQTAKLFDDNILSFASFPKPKNKATPLWIGFDFGKEITIDALGICPRNDKNNIIKDLDYELFYWDRRWVSLGVKTAEDYYLVFNNVPQDALLYVKCTTEGKENRIFTYEKNRQVWW